MWKGAAAPTLTVTNARADWYGFIAKTSSTFDGFTIEKDLG